MSCLAILNPTEHVKLGKYKIRYTFKTNIFVFYFFTRENNVTWCTQSWTFRKSTFSSYTKFRGFFIACINYELKYLYEYSHNVVSLARLRVKYFHNLIINFREREESDLTMPCVAWSSEISVEDFENFPFQNAWFVFGVDLFQCKWPCLFSMTISRCDYMQMKGIINAVFSFCL